MTTYELLTASCLKPTNVYIGEKAQEREACLWTALGPLAREAAEKHHQDTGHPVSVQINVTERIG